MSTDDSPASNPPALVCYRCGATAAFPDRQRCDCGEPLWFDASGRAESFEWPDAEPLGSNRTGIRRYADLLPSEIAERVEGIDGVAAAAGDTPLVRAARLDDEAGCKLWLKDERANPTGSFKDRGSAVGAAWVAGENAESSASASAESGASAGMEKDLAAETVPSHAESTDSAWLGTVSHGNMAVSVAANAAGVGADALVLVPADIAPERLAAIAAYDPEIVRVEGDYGALYRETVESDAPVEFVNSDSPLRVAGQKTTALEICEAFARESGSGTGTAPSPAPDAIVLPTSSGGHASGAWKALRELRDAGLLGAGDSESSAPNSPRLYLVQAAACDPIARAYRDGADEVTPLANPGETVAYSIANPDPPSGRRALAAARETGGAVVSVPDEEILDAKARLATDAGFAVEPSSATALAGVRQLSSSGEIGADEHAVAVLTGRGFGPAGDGEESGESEGEEGQEGSAVETVALADMRDHLRELV